MKDNVDLTKRQDFRKSGLSLPDTLLKSFSLKTGPKDKWEPFSELILTGNKKQ